MNAAIAAKINNVRITTGDVGIGVRLGLGQIVEIRATVGEDVGCSVGEGEGVGLGSGLGGTVGINVRAIIGAVERVRIGEGLG
jgi:hypothetical protein